MLTPTIKNHVPIISTTHISQAVPNFTPASIVNAGQKPEDPPEIPVPKPNEVPPPKPKPPNEIPSPKPPTKPTPNPQSTHSGKLLFNIVISLQQPRRLLQVFLHPVCKVYTLKSCESSADINR